MAEIIEQVKQTVTDFLKKTLNAKDVKIIKVAEGEGGWDAAAEVYEESSFIKALGLSTKVQDRNIYSVKLDGGLKVKSYERREQGAETE